MKIYHVWRTDRVGYDEYDSWVVVASSADRAGEITGHQGRIVIKPVGEAYPEMEEGVLLGSFNAG